MILFSLCLCHLRFSSSASFSFYVALFLDILFSLMWWLIYVSDLSLLVYRNKRDFCVLILYSAILPKEFQKDRFLSFTVLEARNLITRGRRATLPLKPLEEDPSLPFPASVFQHVLWLIDASLCLCLHFCMMFSLCISVFTGYLPSLSVFLSGHQSY